MKQICIAIDTSHDGFDLQSFTSQFKGDVMFKIGLEYFTKFGSKNISKLQSEVFLDLKFFDIPNTVYHAVYNICQIKSVSLLTVHAAGGKEMVRAAVSARNDSKSKAKIICVTKLTSQSASAEEVLTLAKTSMDANADGVVCSVCEIESIRSVWRDITIITPGIRPEWYSVDDDQVRTATPKEAFNEGSNIIVIGRPITTDKKPNEALERIIRETIE